MRREEILVEIRDVMADVLGIDADAEDVTEATTASDIEEWDSLSHIRLLVAIERKFKLRSRFTNSEIESLKRVGDLVTLIEKKTSA